MGFYISVLATILTFVAVFLIAQPKRIGYIYAVGSHICWISYSYVDDQIMLGVQSSILMLIAIKGYQNWKRQGIG